jgi:putative transposase
MFRFFTTLAAAFRSGLRSRRDLVFENLAPRQQLATVLQKHQPRIRPADRLLWVLLRRFWSKWANTLCIVKPKTVVAWHRAGFSIYWKCLPGRNAGRVAHLSTGRSATRCAGWPARTDGELPGSTASC